MVQRTEYVTTTPSNIDSLLKQAIEAAAADVAAAVQNSIRVNERDVMKPALLSAMRGQLAHAVESEKRLIFEDWQAPAVIKLGAIDIAIRREDGSGYSAFVELKWGHPDWMILDFYRMATGRTSPGADACYLIAGQSLKDWGKPDSVCQLFRDGRWRSQDVLNKHRRAFVGDGKEYTKLTRLPPHIVTTLIADEVVPAPLGTWAIKAIRVEPDPLDPTSWLAVVAGQIN